MFFFTFSWFEKTLTTTSLCLCCGIQHSSCWPLQSLVCLVRCCIQIPRGIHPHSIPASSYTSFIIDKLARPAELNFSRIRNKTKRYFFQFLSRHRHRKLNVKINLDWSPPPPQKNNISELKPCSCYLLKRRIIFRANFYLYFLNLWDQSVHTY